jgi:biotin operon repressor
MPAPHFDGSDVKPEDTPRLQKQLDVILLLMMDEEYRSLQEITDITGYPHSSVSAQLRNLRKEKHGGYVVNKTNKGDGYFEYQVKAPLSESEKPEADPLLKCSRKFLVAKIREMEAAVQGGDIKLVINNG